MDALFRFHHGLWFRSRDGGDLGFAKIPDPTRKGNRGTPGHARVLSMFWFCFLLLSLEQVSFGFHRVSMPLSPKPWIQTQSPKLSVI